MIPEELLGKILEEYRKRIKEKDDFQDYRQVQKYALEVSEKAATAVVKNIDISLINEYGTLDYDICNEIITAVLKQNYDLIAQACLKAQQVLNDEASIHIKALKPDYDSDRAHSIVWQSANSNLEEFKKNYPILSENYCQSIVDNAVRKNAEFQYNSGLEPRIVRTAEYKCCRWCSSIEGTYLYEDVKDTGNNVFRRHENCRCTVTYIPTKGNARNVWNKKEINYDVIENYKSLIKQPATFYTDVTKEYFANATPGKGTMRFDDTYEISRHKEEVKIAGIIHKYLGGDIFLLTEQNDSNIKTPDYFWLEHLWELKTISTAKAADGAVRRGIEQILKNPGGIIIDISSVKDNFSEIIEIIDRRISRKGDIGSTLDVIFIKNDQIFKIIRY